MPGIYIYTEISVFGDQCLELSDTGFVCSMLDFFILMVPNDVLRCPKKLITREEHCPADLTAYFGCSRRSSSS